MDGGTFDELARRLTGPRGRRAVLTAAMGAVAAAARALLPSAAEAQGRCRHVFERCRWDDDCCSGHCNGNRCGKGEHGQERRTTRVRRRRERRRERQRRRLEQRRERQRRRQNRRAATASAGSASPDPTPAGRSR